MSASTKTPIHGRWVDVDDSKNQVRRHSLSVRPVFAVALAFTITIAISFGAAFAQRSTSGAPTPPAAWSPELRQYWTNQRNACIALFNDEEKRRSMTPEQLAKLPKMSRLQAHERLEQSHACMRLFPPPPLTNFIPPPKNAGLPEPTPLPTPVRDAGGTIPEKAPTGWDQQFWTSQRSACIALFADMDRYKSMTAEHRAKLPKLSDSQLRDRWGRLKDCMDMYPHPVYSPPNP